MNFFFYKRKLFFFLSLGLFFFAILIPQSTKAVICVYEAQNPNDLPMCHPVGSDAECNAFCEVLGRPCAPDSITRSCDDFLIGQRANQQRRAEQQEFERQREANIPSVENLLRDESILRENAGECLCSVNAQNGVLGPIAGLSLNECYDRDDLAEGPIFNCRWELNENIDNTLQNNINNLEQNDNFKPLQQYGSSLRDLNKLRATSIQGFLGIAIRMATGILGTIALSMMIYGGFLWLTSAGNASQVEKARNVILYGALGIFVIFGSYALVNFVFEAINPIKTL
jgi:hypothetical protein